MYISKQLAAIWQKCIESARLAKTIMTQQCNCATPHSINMDNTEFWITTRSDAPQQTMVLSPDQRRTATFGFGVGQKFKFVRIFTPLWGKTNRKFCRAMIPLNSESFSGNILNLARIFPPHPTLSPLTQKH